jgi:hypothetical protein
MRWSQLHIPTLREDPADADAASHRLLVRAGFIRQLMAGHYSLLPLGIRVRAKVMNGDQGGDERDRGAGVPAAVDAAGLDLGEERPARR